jgi:hypothetical protein
MKWNELNRTPIKHKPKKKSICTPTEVYKEVCIRSGGQWISGKCIGGHCENCHDKKRDWRGLCFAHWGKHRKMGGTRNPEVHSADSVKRACYPCHDLKDKRTFEKGLKKL